MKILICYYSGTGHTKRIVDQYSDTLTKKLVSVDLYNIENSSFHYNPSDYDYIGIAYPIHAFNAPSNVIKFVKSLKKETTRINYFIISVSGEYLRLNESSANRLNGILKRKNYHLTNHYHYLMPYNIIFRHTDLMAYQMMESAKVRINKDCYELINHISYIPKKVFILGRVVSFVLRIEHLGARINGRFYKVDKDKCLKCGLCIKHCPMQNIKLNDLGYPSFQNKCLMCQRCAMNCPESAISIGLFNKWKVGGNYSFEKPQTKEIDKHPNYCKKSYKKYFDETNKLKEEKKDII